MLELFSVGITVVLLALLVVVACIGMGVIVIAAYLVAEQIYADRNRNKLFKK